MNCRDLLSGKHRVGIYSIDLAVILSDLNAAIILCQVEYWIEKNRSAKRNFYDGKYWVYNTYEQWKKDNFPFWSVNTIKRTFKRLEDQGLIIAGNYNKMPMDQTKWYTIDYDRLQGLIDGYTIDPK